MKKDILISQLDGLFEKLIKECDTGISEGLLDKLKVFSEGVKWVSVKNRLDTGDTDDEFSHLRNKYQRSRSGRGRAAGKAAAGVEPPETDVSTH
jgi:hypothetical protein